MSNLFNLDECARWQTNVNGDCGGPVEVREDGKEEPRVRKFVEKYSGELVL